jgi:hypothetical protein
LTPHTFALLLAVGAGAIALWIDVRLPNLRPRKLLVLFAHMLAATVGADFVADRLQGPTAALGGDAGTLTRLFLLQLPGLVYVFIVVVWLLKLVRALTTPGVR